MPCTCLGFDLEKEPRWLPQYGQQEGNEMLVTSSKALQVHRSVVLPCSGKTCNENNWGPDRLSPGKGGGVKKWKPNSSCYRSELTGIGRVTWGRSNVACSSSSGNCQSLIGLHFYIFPSLINTPAEWQKAPSKVFLYRVYTHGHPRSPPSLDTRACIPHMRWALVTCKYVYYIERKYMTKYSIIVCFLFFYI